MVEQFEIYWVSLDPTKRSEIKKARPCVIISPKEINTSLKTVIIAPLTSTLHDFPTRLDVLVKRKKGQIVLDQLRTVDKKRLGAKIGTLNKTNSAQVKEILLEMFQ
jgi:mRNA interferase MazF